MKTRDNQIKRQILEEFLKNLSLIQNKEFQKKIWIEGLGPQVHSFDEAICDFFDLGEYIFANPESYGLTNEQLNLLTKFREQFKDFADEHD